MEGLIILRLDPIILKGNIVLNVDVEGLIIFILSPVILKGRIVLNVDVDELDLVIPKGRIVQDVGTNHP